MKQLIWIDNIKGVACLQCMQGGLHYCVAIMNGLPSAPIELAGLIDDESNADGRAGGLVEWMPIETAPKDGTMMRGYDGKEEHDMCWWEDWGCAPCWDADASGDWQPSFWLPINTSDHQQSTQSGDSGG